jgi:hypothetical protein
LGKEYWSLSSSLCNFLHSPDVHDNTINIFFFVVDNALCSSVLQRMHCCGCNGYVNAPKFTLYVRCPSCVFWIPIVYHITSPVFPTA